MINKCARLHVDISGGSFFPWSMIELSGTTNGGRAQCVTVSKIQWKPFWLATQLDRENNRTGWQDDANNDACEQAPFCIQSRKKKSNTSEQLQWHSWSSFPLKILIRFFKQEASLHFLYHGGKKAKMAENSNQGVCLVVCFIGKTTTGL